MSDAPASAHAQIRASADEVGARLAALVAQARGLSPRSRLMAGAAIMAVLDHCALDPEELRHVVDYLRARADGRLVGRGG